MKGFPVIYLAHFSFENFEEKKRHGSFTCVIDGETFQEALDKFRTLLADLAHRRLVFETPVSIYLDDLTEIHKIPAEGFLAHMITREGPLKNTESLSLPGVDASFCRSFSVTGTEKGGETAEISPFLTF
jgi:hypothetical protein